VIRQVLDVTLAALGLLAVSPVLVVAAALVLCQSPGSALFRHRRVGLGGGEFEVWKLRTMTAGSERGRPLTGAADPRITPVGRILRRWRIDELPQLVNVLRGEMTLVGPRPEVPSVVACYTPEQRLVLSVRPGVTGPSQICWRNEENCYPPGADTEAYYMAEILPRKLASDLEYVRTRSLLRDLGYLWQTLLAMLGYQGEWRGSATARPRAGSHGPSLL
jgi:lipopolysaccharide/colanic/teichoic acid biosynthesis glycosyltransferase